jgi:hypothetical protein
VAYSAPSGPIVGAADGHAPWIGQISHSFVVVRVAGSNLNSDPYPP